LTAAGITTLQTDLEALRDAFNAKADRVRLLLLVSPT
jgi:hypothetical protein